MVTSLIILVNVIMSVMAFRDSERFYRWSFWPERVWRNREWMRMLTGSFIHASIPHILFNMLTLYCFGPIIEYKFQSEFGDVSMLMYIDFYLMAAIVSCIPDLFEHKDNPNYNSVGASGAVSAVVFASILFEPNLLFYGFVPAYIFGILYLVFTVYMAQRRVGNIAHSAHFAGALFGIVFPLIFRPTLFMDCIHKIIAS